MSIVALEGPVISFGQATPPSGQFLVESNPQLGPSMFWGGAGVLDTRAPFNYDPGQHAASFTAAWLGFDNIVSINAVPYTAATAAVVASANPTSANLSLASANSAVTGVGIVASLTRSDTGLVDTNGGAGLVGLDIFSSFTATISGGLMTVSANAAGPIMVGQTLLSTSGAISAGSITGVVVTGILAGNGYVGIYSVSSTSLVAASGTVTSILAGSGNATTTNVSGYTQYPAPLINAVPFGVYGGPSLWNPQAMVGRCLTYTAAAGATYTTATSRGYDVYGFPLTEQVALTAGATVTGKKAFKYLKSVTLSGGTADTTHAYSVGTSDTYGLPLRSDSFGDLLVNYSAALNPAVITANAGYTAAITSASSATTGDVRGTYALQTASATGANRLAVRQSLQPYNVGSATGLFGLAQFADF